jgi:hypothetical protein
MTSQKVLFYDLETAPLLAHVWGARNDWIPHDRFLHDSFILTWAARWRGQKQVRSSFLQAQEAQDQDDTRLVTQLADMVREADIIIAHNVDKFDLPMLNNRVLLLDLEPLGPTKTIDTLKLARKHFRLAHNKLDYLGEVLGLGKKIATTFELWKRAYAGNQTALREMTRYNRRDVELLEDVFDRLLPHVKTPRLFVGADCPHCGSDNHQRRGTYQTNTYTYQRYQCNNNNCSKYFRSRVGGEASEYFPL